MLVVVMVIGFRAGQDDCLHFSLATCVAPSDTMRLLPEEGGFQIISSSIPSSPVSQACCTMSSAWVWLKVQEVNQGQWQQLQYLGSFPWPPIWSNISYAWLWGLIRLPMVPGGSVTILSGPSSLKYTWTRTHNVFLSKH